MTNQVRGRRYRLTQLHVSTPAMSVGSPRLSSTHSSGRARAPSCWTTWCVPALKPISSPAPVDPPTAARTRKMQALGANVRLDRQAALSLSLSLSVSLSLSHTHTHTHTHTNTHIHIHTHIHTLTHTRTHTMRALGANVRLT